MKAFAPLALTLAALAASAHPLGAAEPIDLTQKLTAGATVTPLAIVEDSRCPPDVMCVWAGRLVVQARFEYAGEREDVVMLLHETKRVPGGMLTLNSAAPPPGAGDTRLEGIDGFDLRFSFAPDTAN